MDEPVGRQVRDHDGQVGGLGWDSGPRQGRRETLVHTPPALSHVKRASMTASSCHGARRFMPNSPTPSPGRPKPSTAGSGGIVVVVLSNT